MTAIIHTGSTSIDRLLGGGIRTGIVTDIYGQSGAGKTQLCFTLCANYAKHSRQEDKILFIDTVGTFRPERVSEIAGAIRNSTVLKKIMFVRALSIYDQIHAISLISDFNPRLVIIDTATALISDEFRGPARHLVLMNYIHKLSLAAINFDCAVVITNVIRHAPIRTTLIDQGGHNRRAAIKATNSFQQHEFMGASISIYVHIKLKLEIINVEKSLFGASLMQPIQKDRVLYNITSKGVSDDNYIAG